MSRWIEFKATGYNQPVSGVIYDRQHPATNGLALGGIDTGCLDLETSGMLGYCTLFNSLVPRRGPLNLPLLGLHVDGQTWVLCDPAQTKKYEPPHATTKYWLPPYLDVKNPPLTVGPSQIQMPRVQFPRQIRYWGHYPIADIEFDTDSSVQTSLRAFSPFIPGDIQNSTIPAIIFEVHLQNVSTAPQKTTLVLSFPGPTPEEAGSEQFARRPVEGIANGITISAPKADYTLAFIGSESCRFGGASNTNGPAWANIPNELPQTSENHAGISAAVDLDIDAGQSKTVRFILTWCSPKWRSVGQPGSSAGCEFTHTYAVKYPHSAQTALLLASNHEQLLGRIIAWQQVIYNEKSLPVWLRDSLVNVLYMFSECGLWAAKDPTLFPEWLRPQDGLFGMNESPRSCPQTECIPCSFYGNIPLVYFFPQLALSTLRGYKGYQFPDGEMPWIFDGTTGFNSPIVAAQTTLNGLCYAAMVDRYALCYPDAEFTKEFYPSIKKNTIFTMNLRTDYPPGDNVIAMPSKENLRSGQSVHWFEAPDPGWFGMVPHVGGLHLAQLQIAAKMARITEDEEFEQQCRQWINAGFDALESKLWNNHSYLAFWEPETNRKSELVFAYQLDAQWVARFHGLDAIFRPDRVRTVLETVKTLNIAKSKTGAVNYVDYNDPNQNIGGYGTFSYFPPELLMLAMTYMYEGHRDYGVELARRCWENLICTYRYTWDMPNVMRGDQDTGERVFGTDYYQDMMLWALPAAIAGQDMSNLCKPDGLVNRIIQAGAPQPQNSSSYSVIPQPVNLQPQEGLFAIHPAVVIVADDQTSSLALILNTMFAPAMGFELKTVNHTEQKKDLIQLQLAPALKSTLGPEGYHLNVTPEQIQVQAAEKPGLYYGLVTLKQLLPREIFSPSKVEGVAWNVPCVKIEDYPRFQWRGFMLDTSRTFYGIDVLEKYIDVMALYKLNVFHLHLTDDQGWRVEIKKYPRLTSAGSEFDKKYNEPAHRSGFYTQQQLKHLVAYAESKNITIIPEIDMPGHFWAGLIAYPELSVSGRPQPFEIFPFSEQEKIFGGHVADTLDPTKEEVYKFLDDVLTEIVQIFPFKFIHIGGDEVRFSVWENCPHIQKFMADNNIKDVHALQSYFIGRVNTLVQAKGRTLIGWNEILYGGLPPGAAVMAWTSRPAVKESTAAGALTVASPCSALYLDYWQDEPDVNVKGTGAFNSLETVYSYNPQEGLTEQEKGLLLGVQAAMWTHIARDIKDVNIQVFPRLLALAELGWTPAAMKNFEDFSGRLNEHFSVLKALEIDYYTGRLDQKGRM